MLVWHGAVLLMVIAAFCVTVYRVVWTEKLRLIDKLLSHADTVLTTGMARSLPATEATKRIDAAVMPIDQQKSSERIKPEEIDLDSQARAFFRDNTPGYIYCAIGNANGKPLLVSENAPVDLILKPIDPRAPIDRAYRTSGNRRELSRTPYIGLSSVVGIDLAPELARMRGFTIILIASGFVGWLLGLLIGWWQAGRSLQPLAVIATTVSRIAEGNLDERIDIAATQGELAELGRVLNHTFDRLHATLEHEKQLTADASHELRTPVTVLLSETQRMLKRNRTPDEYRTGLATCHDTALRMRRLVEGLLLLARHESRSVPRHREFCNFAEIARDSAKHLETLATSHNISLKGEYEPVFCEADPIGISQVATNLIKNAIVHNRSGGNVNISCQSTGPTAVLVVTDDGPGILPTDLPHIFQRFFRSPSARSKDNGQSGLGLAVTKAIVQGHGGVVEATSEFGKGSRFVVRLPCTSGISPLTTVSHAT